MNNSLKSLVALAGICALPTFADVSLTYELKGSGMEPQTRTVSIARFFARIDDPKTPDDYLIYQAGKFFPLYRVNSTATTYTRLTPEVNPTLHAGQKPKPATQEKQPQTNAEEKPAEQKEAKVESASVTSQATAEPEKIPTSPSDKETKETASAPAAETVAQKHENEAETQAPKTTLRLTKKTNTIAGVRCRVVEELQDGKPIIRHCMADKARLAMTERETRTLARVFEMGRERDFGWMGTATQDEKFVSIASTDLRSDKTLELKSHSTKPLDVGYLRIPRNFKLVESNQP